MVAVTVALNVIVVPTVPDLGVAVRAVDVVSAVIATVTVFDVDPKSPGLPA